MPPASAWSATSTTGTAAAIRCASTFPAAFGNCSCPAWAKARSTNTRVKQRRPGSREVRSLRFRRRAAAAHRLEGGRSRLATTGTTRPGWPIAAEANALDAPIVVYEVHLGSWRRPGDDPNRWLTYRELAHQLVDYCQRDGLHAPRAAAGQRASLLGKLGLSDGRLLRRHQPLRLAARLHVLCRPLPPERHRRDDRLGAGPFPTRRPRPADVRRHASLRACRSAAGRASRLGHVDLQLRPERSPQLPALQRSVLVRQISHRRAARRCRGLDALSRLQPQAGRMDSQRIRRPREPGRDLVPQGIQRSCRTCNIPAC